MAGRRVPRVVADLDELLFAPGGWFALDASNQRVPAVVIASLRDGLRLVGQGPVTAIVGRLRPQMRVVDVDLEDARGDAAVELVAAWCRQEGLWHLVRPSGGGTGRAHVFVAAAERAQDLEAVTRRVCEQLGASQRSVDVRDTVRPLSSPHRNGAMTTAYGNLSEALLGLRAHSWASQVPKSRRRRSRTHVSATPAVPVRRRARKELPAQWQDYLEHGALPLVRVDNPQHSRSNIEATATAAMLRCGYDAVAAWAAIQEAHGDAFGKARTQGHAWWVKYVWNPAVADDDSFIPVGTGDADPALDTAVNAARSALEDLAWRLPTRQRPALLLVGHAVLDRICRAGERRVPVPERDLVLDTGLNDRKTIRAQLRILNGALGTLHTEAWDPIHHRDSSSFEFEIPPAQGVSEIPPPNLHTPLPHGVWAALPRPCHQLWRALRKADRAVSLDELAAHALLTPTSATPPSPSQIRAARVALLALSEAGLASCSAEGTWTYTKRPEARFVAKAMAEHEVRTGAVLEERRVYRAGERSRWSLARAAALKEQRAREVAWWQGLPPAAREQRQAELSRRFQAESVMSQERLKSGLADRRLRHGVDEPARYRSWLASLSDDELTWRSQTRAAAFATFAAPLQQALVAAWERHRDRYGLPHRSATVSTRVEQHALLPVGARQRDEALWQQQEIPISATAQRLA